MTRGARSLVGVALATVSGVATFLAFPNANLWPLAFVSLAPLWWASEHATVRRAFGLGWVTGFVTNAGGFYWVYVLVRDFGYMPSSIATLAVVLLALQQGVAFGIGAALGRLVTTRAPAMVVVAYPAAMVVGEAIVPMIFPWRLGHSQWLAPAFGQLAELGGVGLVSLLVCCVSGAIAGLLGPRRGLRHVRRSVSVVGVLLIASFCYGQVRIVQMDRRVAGAETLSVGLVEANIGIYEKTDPSLRSNNLLIHQQLSAQLAEQGAELIVWPETAYQPAEATPRANVRYFASRSDAETIAEARMLSSVVGRLPRLATWLPASPSPLVGDNEDDVRARTPASSVVPPHRGFAVPLLMGTLMWSDVSPEERATSPIPLARRAGLAIHNSAVLLSEEGRVLGVYDKNLRMPVSEQMPLGHTLYRRFGFNVYEAVPMVGEFYRGTPGDGLRLPRADGRGDWHLGVSICYEGIMPGHHRAIHAQRPDLLVNITNDAWFGKTSEPYLHLALATFRTIEQRTAMVRSTNTGVSAIVDPLGRVVAETSIEGAETLRYDVPMLRATTTPFMRLGDWPTWLCGAFLLVALLRPRRGLPGPKSRDESEG